MRGRLLGAPVELHWLGWRSDTHTLSRNGWDISADQDVCQDTMRIAVRHPETNVGGISQMTRWEYSRYATEGGQQMGRRLLPIVLIERFGDLKRTQYHLAGPIEFNRYSPVDAVPSFVAEEPKCLEDLVHFATHNQKRLIIPEESVDDLMARILKMQEPGRQEHFLREAQHAQDLRHAPRLEAQILSLRAA